MRLTDLNPFFLYTGGPGVVDASGNHLPRRDGVGVAFDCPCGCETRIIVLFENPIDGGEPVHGNEPKWKRNGEEFHDLTLSPSIQRLGGCRWHGFVRHGEIINAL